MSRATHVLSVVWTSFTKVLTQTFTHARPILIWGAIAALLWKGFGFQPTGAVIWGIIATLVIYILKDVADTI